MVTLTSLPALSLQHTEVELYSGRRRRTLNKQFKLCLVDILYLCRDISKLFLGIVSHRCSDSVLSDYLVSLALLAVAHHRQDSPPTSDFPWLLSNSPTLPGFPGRWPPWVVKPGLSDSQSSSQITTTKHQCSAFFTGQMPFPSPNQQCQCTEGMTLHFATWRHERSTLNIMEISPSRHAETAATEMHAHIWRKNHINNALWYTDTNITHHPFTVD